MNYNRDTQKIEEPSGSRAPVILLVEDDDPVRELLAVLLKGDGYEVIELGDGIEALSFMAAVSAFEDSHPRPDIIISDLQMPMFSGLDLLVGMSEHRSRPPLILFTGQKDPDLVAEAYRLGAARVLLKPISPELLSMAIREVLEQAATTAVSSVREMETELSYEPVDQGF